MIQASLSGIIFDIILALSRAVGETMAVTLRLERWRYLQTFPSGTNDDCIYRSRVGRSGGEIGYLTIFAVGLYLFVITLTLNLIGNRVLAAYREAY